MAKIEIDIVDRTIIVTAVPTDPPKSQKGKKVKWKNKSNAIIEIDFEDHTPLDDYDFEMQPGDKVTLITTDEANNAGADVHFKYTVRSEAADEELDPELIIEPEP
jgi:hypothetical protein